ncbi:unnamed protein product [Musa hybrid cultivar]
MEMSWSMVMLGEGRLPTTEAAVEARASLRPRRTSKKGPPSMETRSRVASARTSAQETTPGHWSSRAVLARTTASKASPGREMLSSESRSARLKALVEISKEASQPPTKQSWKKRRRAPAAVVGVVICLLVTTSDTICSALGHLFW